MKHLLTLVLCAFVFYSCSDGSSAGDPAAGSFLILNEGAFGQGNASISLWNPETGELRHNVFATRNTPRVLGDVLQSGITHEDEIFLVVNNSRRIEILDAETFASRRTITFSGGASPRYMAITNESTAYVTSLFTDYVYIVDFREAVVTDSIHVGAGSEGIAVVDGYAYVARNLNADFSSASGIAVIRLADREVIDVLETGPAPQQIVFNSGSLWSNLAGTWGGDNGGLVQISPVDRSVLREIGLGKNTSGLSSSAISSNIYLISDGVYRINTSNIDEKTKISDVVYYAISVAGNNDTLYGFDARNFAQAGMMYVYENPMIRADSIRTGIVPRALLSLQ